MDVTYQDKIIKELNTQGSTYLNGEAKDITFKASRIIVEIADIEIDI